MLHAARPRGPKQGRRRISRTGKKRERFETETHTAARRIGAGCPSLPPCRSRTARAGTEALHLRAGANRPTIARQ